MLLSPAGLEALQAASGLEPEEGDFLRHFTWLARRYPDELARAALETAILRREAAGKFPCAAKMYFTRPALEQASGYVVSSYRVRRFEAFDGLLDLGCSVGGDTLSLACLAPVVGVDLDPLRLLMAQANMQALELDGCTTFVQADLNACLPLSRSRLSGMGAFFDPGRRVDGRRVHSIGEYKPPLGVLRSWLVDCPAFGVKISPGVDLDELKAFDAEIEFISYKNELKEAVLWFGPLKTARRRATVLPGPHTFVAPLELADESGEAGAIPGRVLPLDEPRAYIYEPDPAILRAGLVQPLGLQLDAAQLDPEIAYLTSDKLVETPFARAWQVEAWLPFNLKNLREELRQRCVSQVVVKKRGSPIQPEHLIRQLRLRKRREATQEGRVVFLTHLNGRPIVILCWSETSASDVEGVEI
jgi:hypothetical protein